MSEYDPNTAEEYCIVTDDGGGLTTTVYMNLRGEDEEQATAYTLEQAEAQVRRFNRGKIEPLPTKPEADRFYREKEAITPAREDQLRAEVQRIHLQTALVAAQGEMTLPGLDAQNPYYHSRYTSLAELIKTARPVLAKYGLGFVWHNGRGGAHRGEDHWVSLELIHDGGGRLECGGVLIPKSKDAKSLKAEHTVARRILLESALGLCGDEAAEDDSQAGRAQRAAQAAGLDVGAMAPATQADLDRLKMAWFEAHGNDAMSRTERREEFEKFATQALGRRLPADDHSRWLRRDIWKVRDAGPLDLTENS